MTLNIARATLAILLVLLHVIFNDFFGAPSETNHINIRFYYTD